MILLLPILTKISLTMPIKAYLIFDIIGIVVAFSLFSPTVEYSAKDEKGEKLLSQLKRFKGTGFYTTSLFLGIIGAFILVISPFKELFVESLGLPIVYIGSIMALSRLIWFIVGHNLSIIKKIQIKKLLFYEIFFFSGLIIISSQSKNPYLAGILIAIMIGYYFGRSPIFDEYYLNNFLINKRYKATMLSTKQLISKLLSSGLVLATGIVMTISFNLGFLISGISMLIMLLIIYPFLKKYIK